MKLALNWIVAVLVIVSWLAGVVLASGFWSTAFAICFPPYAWYLVVERAMVMAGWVGA